MKSLFILVAQIKYPSSDSFFLTANSYVVEKGSTEGFEAAIETFRNEVEVDGFKLINFMAYVVPDEQIKGVTQ